MGDAMAGCAPLVRVAPSAWEGPRASGLSAPMLRCESADTVTQMRLSQTCAREPQPNDSRTANCVVSLSSLLLRRSVAVFVLLVSERVALTAPSPSLHPPRHAAL